MTEPADIEFVQHLRRELDDGELDQQFSAIERGLERRRRGRRAAWTGAAAAAALVLVVLGLRVVSSWQSTAAADPWRGEIAATASEPQRLILTDGSRLSLAPATQLSMCPAEGRDLCVELDHGSVELEVSKDPSRTFRVEVGQVEIRVVGTRFVVEHAPELARMRVEVFEGVVAVRRDDGTERRLGAGERWELSGEPGHRRVLAERERPDAARSSPPDQPDEKTAVDGHLRDDALDADGTSHAADPSEASATDGGGLDVDGGEAGAAKPRPTPADEPRAADRPHAAVEAEPDAAALWSAARAARREGEAEAEADAYAELLRRFPNAQGGGLAAFELGRLRMDEQRDLGGAVKALERAIALGGDRAPYHEDALARLVRAHSRLGAQARCRDARARYLEAYPRGVHLATVSVLCPD